MRRHVLAVAPVVASAATFLLISGIVPRAAAQESAAHGNGRDQWQPQTEEDNRLQQPVKIEILGRAIIPALKQLAEKTGVTLQVAPENVENLGERKITIIAQGCTLKALMVQIPKALQECYWDVVTTGEKPVYWLHRNDGMETVIGKLVEANRDSWQAERRPVREARVEEARKAMNMTPEELAELAKTDPLLAATMKDPEAKARLQLFLNLPPASMQDFIKTGRAYMDYADAPEAFQQAARQSAANSLAEEGQRNGPDSRMLAWAKALNAHVSEVGVSASRTMTIWESPCSCSTSTERGPSETKGTFSGPGIATPRGRRCRPGSRTTWGRGGIGNFCSRPEATRPPPMPL